MEAAHPRLLMLRSNEGPTLIILHNLDYLCLSSLHAVLLNLHEESISFPFLQTGFWPMWFISEKNVTSGPLPQSSSHRKLWWGLTKEWVLVDRTNTIRLSSSSDIRIFGDSSFYLETRSKLPHPKKATHQSVSLVFASLHSETLPPKWAAFSWSIEAFWTYDLPWWP